MRIVKATNPPSMCIIVDTVVAGEVALVLVPSHAEYNRIDIVFAKRDMVGVLTGTPSASPLRPTLAEGMRKLAEIRVTNATSCVYNMCIMEEGEQT